MTAALRDRVVPPRAVPSLLHLPRVAALLAALIGSAGCGDVALTPLAPAPVAAAPVVRARAPGPAPATGSSAAPSPAPGAAADRIEGGFEELEVPGFRPSVVYVPPGPVDRVFPLAVASHGAGGMSEPHCENWSRLLRERAYVVCPRGTPYGLVVEGQAPTGYFYRDHRALGREVMAARAAAIAAFGARLDPKGALYAGYSQGATMGVLFLHELAATPGRGAFARLVLLDGGWLEWTRDLATKEHESGLARVVLVCGQARCAREAKQRVGWMEQAGLPIRFEYAQGAGHTWGGAVAEKLQGSLAWLFADDPRFLRVD